MPSIYNVKSFKAFQNKHFKIISIYFLKFLIFILLINDVSKIYSLYKIQYADNISKYKLICFTIKKEQQRPNLNFVFYLIIYFLYIVLFEAYHEKKN